MIFLGFEGFLQFASNLGGLTGIWVGASLVSFVEILELFFDWIMIAVQKVRMSL